MTPDTTTMHWVAIKASKTAEIYWQDAEKARQAKVADLMEIARLEGAAEALDNFAEQLWLEMNDYMEEKK